MLGNTASSLSASTRVRCPAVTLEQELFHDQACKLLQIGCTTAATGYSTSVRSRPNILAADSMSAQEQHKTTDAEVGHHGFSALSGLIISRAGPGFTTLNDCPVSV